jgi:hypothetical protein
MDAFDRQREFDQGAYVSARVHVKGDLVRTICLLRGRMVRTGGVAVAAEVDVLDHNFNHTGRTTLVHAKTVEPLTEVARRQIDDMGHNPLCICGACVEARKAGTR